MPRKSTQRTAVYLRVSSDDQEDASQRPDIERWLSVYAVGDNVKWYSEKASGETMNRPVWNQLMDEARKGKITKLVIYKLDRLGRCLAMGPVLEELRRLKVTVVSVNENFDLSTDMGELIANILISVSNYERKTIKKRQRDGINAALKDIKAGKRKHWGGSEKGKRKKLTADKIEIIHDMHAKRKPIAAIARAVGVSRPTVYSVLNEVDSEV